MNAARANAARNTVSCAERAGQARLLGIAEALEEARRQLPDSPGTIAASIRRIARALLTVEASPLLLETAAQVAGAPDEDLPRAVTTLLSALRSSLRAARLECETVLAVDDDPCMRLLVSKVLAQRGLRVVLAENLAEAERLLETEPISLLVLDICLPDGDSRDLLARLRRRASTAQLPVLMVSSEPGRLPEIESLALGADAYLPKPVDCAALRTTVARLLARQARLDAVTRLDPETGLSDLDALEEGFCSHQALANRTQHPYALARIDLDGTAKVAETYGVVEADRYLRWFAKQLMGYTNPSDLLARIGDHAFAILFPATSGDVALSGLTNVLRTIQHHPFRTQRETELVPYFSVGVVHVEPQDRSDLARVLSEAEGSLTSMKKTGRFQRPVQLEA